MYARNLGDRTLTFGVSGRLIRNSLVMFDRETGSLWSHLTGSAIDGPLRGRHLTVVGAQQATWGLWRREHPGTLMLKVQPSELYDPYDSYYASGQTGVISTKHHDPRLDAKERVIGIRLQGAVKAYAFTALARDRVVDDSVGGTDLVVVFDGSSQSGAVWKREVNGVSIHFRPGPTALTMIDDSGVQWAGLNGSAADGRRLEQIPITYSFWFGWSDFYPDTDVYR